MIISWRARQGERFRFSPGACGKIDTFAHWFLPRVIDDAGSHHLLPNIMDFLLHSTGGGCVLTAIRGEVVFQLTTWSSPSDLSINYT